MRPSRATFLAAISFALASCSNSPRDVVACGATAAAGLRAVASERTGRFLGKVHEATARCRGGEKAVERNRTPWVDWPNYWGTGGPTTRAPSLVPWWPVAPDTRGLRGALLDLEYQRIELIRFNLFDNSGTYQAYVTDRDGAALQTWPEMELPPGDPNFAAVGGHPQVCHGQLIRGRTLTGICNDVYNPAMGSTGMPFARNVELDVTFPDLARTSLARNRHGDRIGLLAPDAQVISRRLFTRAQAHPERCNDGRGLDDDSPRAECDYLKANTFNVLAAFWIQFMTHDWFSHLDEGHNDAPIMPTGCRQMLAGGVERPLSAAEVAALGCRPDDVIDRAFVAAADDPATFTAAGRDYLRRAYRTTPNSVTAWWDGSQLYGYDATSRRRVKRDPADRAKLLVEHIGTRAGAGEAQGYLPLLGPEDPKNPVWEGQEAAAFADNWSIGTSFFHNVFAREHNLFVTTFRNRTAVTPDEDSGLRDPDTPHRVIRYRDVTDDELFEVARLVVAAEIAKIHTIEWTTQLLYDEPLFLGMNANWSGIFHDQPLVSDALRQAAASLGGASAGASANAWHSIFAAGSGIVGFGARKPGWSIESGQDVNGGVRHFGSPFAFPEEFITVYRLHPLVPDLLELRTWDGDPNVIRAKVPVVRTFRGQATAAMRREGLASWAVTMGRQRVGRLTLGNHPRFLQNLPLMGRIPSSRTDAIDVPALDLLRDRERGVPRYNEFRRQYGLRQLTSFDDFVDGGLDSREPGTRRELERQQAMVRTLREVYGQHRCSASKEITSAQVNDDGTPITDCLGRPDGSVVDNIEDVDPVVGMLAESTRPHGFAISETQFQVFILNASRRLFSDRFFTSSFRPEFYSDLGIEWVDDNGPDGPEREQGRPNGHPMEVSPLKRVLLRTIPELGPELEPVINVFDPWARDRGEYYALEWKPRTGAEADPAFREDDGGP